MNYNNSSSSIKSTETPNTKIIQTAKIRKDEVALTISPPTAGDAMLYGILMGENNSINKQIFINYY